MTTAELDHVLKPGYAITVGYLRPDAAQTVIRDATHGNAEHVLCCLGGTDIVEADTTGVSRTHIFNYMRGQCVLTVRRPRVAIAPAEARRVRKFWLDQVGHGYGWGSLAAAFNALLLRRHRRLLRLARRLLGQQLPDCSALWVQGVRQVLPGLLAAYEYEEVSPETILRDPHLETVATWHAPVLEDA